jgi:acyl carrier protein
MDQNEVNQMETDSLTRRVCEMAAAVFDVPPEQVTPDSSTDTIEQWDSLGRLTLVLELEQGFGVQLPPEVTEELTSVRSIVAVLTELGVTDEAVA